MHSNFIKIGIRVIRVMLIKLSRLVNNPKRGTLNTERGTRNVERGTRNAERITLNEEKV
jgi:hypothetical protein